MNLPSPLSPNLEDSGEGGMYVIVAVTEEEDARNECRVDVNILLTEPDALLSPGRVADVWGDGMSNVAYPDRMSLPLRAAVFLGSTSVSLWDEAAGNYWCASPEDPTDDGRVLYDMLRRMNGVEPVLLTFLDT